MTKKLLSTLIASLFASAPALAQSDDPMRVEGSATLGGIYNRTSATDNAKLTEYQDLSNGALSNVGIRGRNSTTWILGYGENFGRTDQYMFMGGGIYDVFKAGAYLNDIPHTFSSNAYSPYNGNGGNLLTATFPQTALPSPNPPPGWSNFTLGYERRDAGGFFEWQKNSPWYARVDGNEVKFTGTKVGAAANGTSPGNGYVDLAFPNNSKTSNVGVEGGYQSGKASVAVRWDYSKFDNGSQTLGFTNPYFGGNNIDTVYLAPDNEFNKFTLTGNYRDLPWRSVISARYTWAKTTSDANLGQLALNTGPAYRPTLSDTNTFSGENINQSFALAWTATPVSNVDSRVYYYWTKLTNKSDIVDYGNAPTQPLASGLGCQNVAGTAPNTFVPGNCESENYNYTKNNVGFDVWWKFARSQRVGLGWDYNDLDQERPDYNTATWNKFWVEGPDQVPVRQARLGPQFHDQRPHRQRPELPARVHVVVRPAEHDGEHRQAEPRLEPDAAGRRGLRGQLVEPGLRRRHARPNQVRPPGLLPVRQLGQGRAADAERLRQLGADQVPVEPPLHRHRGQRSDAAAGLLHACEPELLQPVRAAVPGEPGVDDRVVQLELADQGRDLDDRPGRRLAGDGRAQAVGVVPVRQERR